MARSSDKLNIIDQNTFKNLKKGNENTTPKILHSAKYKNKHKNKQQCSLLDFLIVPREQHKKVNKLKRPHTIIARNCVTLQTKRKGKTRLHPKNRVARLKRIIKNYRIWKQSTDEDPQWVEALQKAFSSMSVGLNSISETSVENNVSVAVQSSPLLNVEPNTLELITDLKNLSINETELKTKSKPQAHKIHSRRFRSYCDNCTTAKLKELSGLLLNDLERFQKRAYANNEIKARAHLRLVVGFRESLSRLRIHKVKLLLLAPDCEQCPGPGGLDETIDELKTVCQEQNVPYCFSLMRRELSYSLHKRAQISCVAILDYDGSNETFKQLLKELDEARIQYKSLTAT
ncbi:selenocysteine insertion sequence-binding protein 2 [Drosophila grimshawi]|uniref:selenocysteine insertion sequence-binding protein 2 n=1 Tax=Drosophila grimshawi TaxID=7222 RepID=UPI000C86F462|nr:selenocysteine insertion sequence-binding protein 2 [Drosophila grimshawi]